MFRSDAERRAAFAAMHGTTAQLRSGNRAQRFLKRHPGVRQTLHRAAGVATVSGGLYLGSRVVGRRHARHLLALRDLRVSGAMLRAVRSPQGGSQGLRALKQAVHADTGQLFRTLRRSQQRKLNLQRGAAATGFVGGLWAAHPASEARADVLERRHVHHPIVIVRRRRARGG